MFKKVNAKVLSLLFILLLVFVVIILITENKHEDSSAILRNTNFSQIDTAKITQMIIYPKQQDQIEVNIKSQGWTIQSGDKTFRADKETIKGLLQELANIKVQRLVSKSKDSWNKYQVTDSLGVRVVVKEYDKTTADIVIGKFTYQQGNNQYSQNQRNNMTFSSFIRNYNADVIYMIDGMMSMNFNVNINSLRNKNICNVNKTDIKKVTFTYPADSSFALTNNNGEWNINGIKADSLKIEKFLSSISHLSSTHFMNEINDSFLPKNLYTVKIEGDNFNPIEIASFPYKSNGNIIKSSINLGTYFSGDEDKNLLSKLFIGKSSLI